MSAGGDDDLTSNSFYMVEQVFFSSHYSVGQYQCHKPYMVLYITWLMYHRYMDVHESKKQMWSKPLNAWFY